MRFSIVIPTWEQYGNGVFFLTQLINSIKSQTLDDYEVIISDHSINYEIQNLCKEFNQSNILHFRNENNRGNSPFNLNFGLSRAKGEIIKVMFQDDFFINPNALELISNSFILNNCKWLANGCFKYHDGRMGFAAPHSDFEGIRHKPFTLSHIRTWRAFLWKNIKVEDLKDENGKYWDVAGDLAFMFPMVEMSGIEHYKFMYDVNYVYNEENPLNDHKLHLWRVQHVNSIIRNYKSYEKL